VLQDPYFDLSTPLPDSAETVEAYEEALDDVFALHEEMSEYATTTDTGDTVNGGGGTYGAGTFTGSDNPSQPSKVYDGAAATVGGGFSHSGSGRYKVSPHGSARQMLQQQLGAAAPHTLGSGSGGSARSLNPSGNGSSSRLAIPK
jgi:hypothetical protein